MASSKTLQPVIQKASGFIMLIVLLWLTVSFPFVYASEQAQKETVQKQQAGLPDEEDSNPLTNTTEEKGSNVNTLSEYLHNAHAIEHAGVIVSKQYKTHVSDLYRAFHPELISPPPDAS